MFEKQGWHVLLLALLLVVVAVLARSAVLTGQLWGISSEDWLWVAVAIPVIHQIFVWLFWRLELHHGLITRWFGDNGFSWISDFVVDWPGLPFESGVDRSGLQPLVYLGAFL